MGQSGRFGVKSRWDELSSGFDEIRPQGVTPQQLHTPMGATALGVQTSFKAGKKGLEMRGQDLKDRMPGTREQALRTSAFTGTSPKVPLTREGHKSVFDPDHGAISQFMHKVRNLRNS